MLPKQNYQFILLSIMVSIVVRVFGDIDEATFQKRFATSISLASSRDYKNKGMQGLYNGDLEVRRALCILAQKNASMPLINEDQYIFQAQLYQMEFSGSSEVQFITAIDCRSYPSLYLDVSTIYSKDSDDDRNLYSDQPVSLIFVENSRYTYLKEIVSTMIPADSLLAIGVQTKYHEHHFYQLSPADRWNLCWAACDRGHESVEFLEQHRNKSTVDYFLFPRIFFVNSKLLDVVIECPTSPTMYLGLEYSFSGFDYSGNRVIKIMFVDAELVDDKELAHSLRLMTFPRNHVDVDLTTSSVDERFPYFYYRN